MNKQLITEAHTAIRSFARLFAKMQAALADPRSDCQNLEAKIAAIGEPDYRDDSATAALAVLQLQRTACGKVVAQREADLLAFVGTSRSPKSLISIILAAARLTSEVLREARDRRVATVAAVFRPFFTDEPRAIQAARASDICATATRRVEAWAQLRNSIGLAQGAVPLERLSRLLAELEEILADAASDSPSTQRFLGGNPPAE